MTPETLRGASAEILGTGLFVGLLVIFGAIASRLLGAGAWVLLASTSAVAVALVGILVNLRPVSGAHLNPAITLGAAIQGDVQWTKVLPNVVAQLLGSCRCRCSPDICTWATAPGAARQNRPRSRISRRVWFPHGVRRNIGAC